MRTVKKLVAAAVMAAMACGTASASGSQVGTVTSIIIRNSDGLVYFFLAGKPAGIPACATVGPGYWMIKDENSAAGKRQLAVLLAARLSGQPVSVAGAGSCTRWVNGEDVETIQL